MHLDGDDTTLLRRARRDPEAFGLFYRRHANGVYRALLAGCRDEQVALDLTAETFAHALLQLGSFRGARPASGAAWIHAIARSQLELYRRREVASTRARRRLGLHSPAADAEDDRLVDRLDAADRLGRQLDRLPSEQRAVLQLRVVDEASYAEISDRLAISEASARQQVSRALRFLSRRLGGAPS
jgi:RNA polymerase sigma-70 factor, ECF subfamily